MWVDRLNVLSLKKSHFRFLAIKTPWIDKSFELKAQLSCWFWKYIIFYYFSKERHILQIPVWASILDCLESLTTAACTAQCYSCQVLFLFDLNLFINVMSLKLISAYTLAFARLLPSSASCLHRIVNCLIGGGCKRELW